LATLLVYATLPAQIIAGDSSAPLGAEAWFVAVLPPPGTYFVNYLAYYQSDKLKDENGHTALDIDFNVNVVAEVPRLFYISDIKILGGNLAGHIVVPIVYQEMKLKPPVGGFTEDHFGLGDMVFSPFVIGWHSKLFHWVVGLDFIAPTGQYDKEDYAPIGANHWTFEPWGAISLIHPSGISASIKLGYDIHTENTDAIWHYGETEEKVDYLTGQQFHFDYNAGIEVVTGLRLGVCGYFLKGLQNDKIDGEEVEGSREMVFAIGPSALYNINPTTLITVKAQFEMEAENRPQGSYIWIKTLYGF